MAKKITAQVKLQIPAGKATPAPPVGTALGPQGVNIMDFCKAFNAKTSAKDQEGLIIPVVITIYSDRSFTLVVLTPASLTISPSSGSAMNVSGGATTGNYMTFTLTNGGQQASGTITLGLSRNTNFGYTI